MTRSFGGKLDRVVVGSIVCCCWQQHWTQCQSRWQLLSYMCSSTCTCRRATIFSSLCSAACAAARGRQPQQSKQAAAAADGSRCARARAPLALCCRSSTDSTDSTHSFRLSFPPPCDQSSVSCIWIRIRLQDSRSTSRRHNLSRSFAQKAGIGAHRLH